MSDLGCLTSSRVNGDGAQRLVEGIKGGQSSRPCGQAREDSSSSNSESRHTHVNVDGVIMWLKPIGDAWAETFWKKCSFPPSV